jgi:hypothetical protein
MRLKKNSLCIFVTETWFVNFCCEDFPNICKGIGLRTLRKVVFRLAMGSQSEFLCKNQHLHIFCMSFIAISEGQQVLIERQLHCNSPNKGIVKRQMSKFVLGSNLGRITLYPVSRIYCAFSICTNKVFVIDYDGSLEISISSLGTAS